MDHDGHPGHDTPPSFWRSRYAVGLLVIGAVAAYFLLGFLLQWPTVLTLLMFPVLLLMYGRLAITEEAEMRAQFGAEFERYAQDTPRFIPHFGSTG